MAVDRTPVLKRCRSLGMEPMYLGIDKKSNRKSTRANRKVSEYGLQLREKQKAKFIYGVLEKPFRNLYAKAEQQKGLTGPNLMTLLELRLDNVIFRLGLARTRKEAGELSGWDGVSLCLCIDVETVMCQPCSLFSCCMI